MKILVTGGAGYIGSHTCVVLLEAGHEVIVLDNLSNCSITVIKRIQYLTGKKIKYVNGDIRHKNDLDAVFKLGVDAVIHFASLKSVGDSCEQPLVYFDNNVVGTIRLLEAMSQWEVKHLVFSSSATVYGQPVNVPVNPLWQDS